MWPHLRPHASLYVHSLTSGHFQSHPVSNLWAQTSANTTSVNTHTLFIMLSHLAQLSSTNWCNHIAHPFSKGKGWVCTWHHPGDRNIHRKPVSGWYLLSRKASANSWPHSTAKAFWEGIEAGCPVAIGLNSSPHDRRLDPTLVLVHFAAHLLMVVDQV